MWNKIDMAVLRKIILPSKFGAEAIAKSQSYPTVKKLQEVQNLDI